jgi:hypothetical protein
MNCRDLHIDFDDHPLLLLRLGNSLDLPTTLRVGRLEKGRCERQSVSRIDQILTVKPIWEAPAAFLLSSPALLSFSCRLSDGLYRSEFAASGTRITGLSDLLGGSECWSSSSRGVSEDGALEVMGLEALVFSWRSSVSHELASHRCPSRHYCNTIAVVVMGSSTSGYTRYARTGVEYQSERRVS